MMWKIVRALYGLKQAPREWYRKLREWLLQWGYRISAFDQCVFIHDELRILLGI
jgi:hypothetical protein